MSNSENRNKSGKQVNLFMHDLGWYFLGTLIPMIAGFARTPVFTRYFTPEEYGYLGIVTITFSFISVALFSWLGSCMWRYYNHFSKQERQGVLYSNLFVLYVASALVMAAVALIWAGSGNNSLVNRLALLSYGRFLLSETAGLILIVIRLEGKALKYNSIQSIRALLSFGLLVWMTFIKEYRIEAVLTSYIAVDLLALLFLAADQGKRLRISLKAVSKEALQMLLRYGIAGLIANLGMLALVSSDRYIIALYHDMGDVGIYNQVYNISQISIAALVAVFFNTINPTLIKRLEFDYEGSGILIYRYIQLFILFGIPVVAIASLFSREISLLLLGPEFREGFTVMPWIFISAFLYGLSLFYEARLKFANKLKAIAVTVIFSGAINIALNFLFVPYWGYEAAAVTTLACYLLLFILFYLNDSLRYFSQRQFLRFLVLPAVWLVVIIFSDLILKKWMDQGLWFSMSEAAVFIILYIPILYVKLRKFDFSGLAG
ncbi:MAG: polysaccharide biosynthesis protein [Bacteroidales bacterium]|nr:polysaccharide biosynthesis protein [Bacteroidales bacterium]